MPPRREKRFKYRRGRFWEFVDGVWVKQEVPKPVIIPSSDPVELRKQLYKARQGSILPTFLEAAIPTDAFNASHALLTFHLVGEQRLYGGPKALEEMQAHAAVDLMAGRCRDLVAEAEPADLDPLFIANALRAVAVWGADLPSVRAALTTPLLSHALVRADDFLSTQAAHVVWAVTELWDHIDEARLKEGLLLSFVRKERLESIRSYLRRCARQEEAMLRTSFQKLRKEVPHLRQLIPG